MQLHIFGITFSNQNINELYSVEPLEWNVAILQSCFLY